MQNKYHNVAVVILAGGKSARAETAKGLRIIKKQFWIDILIQHFKDLGIGNIFVGLGFGNQEYLKYSSHLKNSDFVINPNPENGSFSTFQNVLKNHINDKWKQTIVIHIDHAIPNKKTLDTLLNSGDYSVIKPTYKGKTGHPTIISHLFCKQLINKPSHSQLNTEIKKLNIKQVKWVAVEDKNILENFNTKQQWQNYKNSV
ncbi:MAG: NTP transferase domain-containing protein [Proteobacteria bacterium]|nr:NTP transferase domain-containing protein [Pseudomonadota bacterium]